MTLSATDLGDQARLKRELQDNRRASTLENLAAALLGRLLGVPIAVAKSGFQHGGDAGPAGQQGRRFRLECKKYSDTTSLSNRELLGEIDHALARDEALEAWFLVATRSVPEQLMRSRAAAHFSRRDLDVATQSTIVVPRLRGAADTVAREAQQDLVLTANI